MRDPDYVVRGYKAALHRRSTSPAKTPSRTPSRTPSIHVTLTWCSPEDSEKDNDRPRHRIVLGGQPYVAEGARGGILSREVRERMESHAYSAPKDAKAEKATTEGEESNAVAKDGQ